MNNGGNGVIGRLVDKMNMKKRGSKFILFDS